MGDTSGTETNPNTHMKSIDAMGIVNAYQNYLVEEWSKRSDVISKELLWHAEHNFGREDDIICVCAVTAGCAQQHDFTWTSLEKNKIN